MSDQTKQIKQVKQVNSEEVPKWTGASLPEDAKIIMLVDEDNFDYGGKLQAAYRLDLDRIVPNLTKTGTIYSVSAPGGADISVPDETVVPAYVEAFDPFEIKRAQATDPTTKARFLILQHDQNVDDAYVIQGSGFYSFPDIHNYLVGQTYYLSDSAPGGVTNTPPGGITQPLFDVIDQKTILIRIGD